MGTRGAGGAGRTRGYWGYGGDIRVRFRFGLPAERGRQDRDGPQREDCCSSRGGCSGCYAPSTRPQAGAWELPFNEEPAPLHPQWDAAVPVRHWYFPVVFPEHEYPRLPVTHHPPPTLPWELHRVLGGG